MPLSRSSLMTEVKVRSPVWPPSSLVTVGPQASPSRLQLGFTGGLGAGRRSWQPHVHAAPPRCGSASRRWWFGFYYFKHGCWTSVFGLPPRSRQHMYQPEALWSLPWSEQTCVHTWRIHLDAFFPSAAGKWRRRIVWWSKVSQIGSVCPEWVRWSGNAPSIGPKSHHSCILHEDALNMWKQIPIFTFQTGTDLLAEVEAKSIHARVIGLLRLVTRGTLSDLFLIVFWSFLRSVWGKCKFPHHGGWGPNLWFVTRRRKRIGLQRFIIMSSQHTRKHDADSLGWIFLHRLSYSLSLFFQMRFLSGALAACAGASDLWGQRGHMMMMMEAFSDRPDILLFASF